MAPSVLRLPSLIALLCSAAAGFSSASQAAEADDWHVYVGDAVIDTVSASVAEATEAGRWVLTRDAWTLDRFDPSAAKLVTHWKPVKHPLIKLATGKARVRVAVAMRDVGRGRTELQVLGGIATESDLTGSPVFSLAQSAGQHECKGFVRQLKARLADVRIAGSAPAGGLKLRSDADQR